MGYLRGYLVLLCAASVLGSIACAPCEGVAAERTPAQSSSPNQSQPSLAQYRGWDFLVDRLKEHSLSDAEINHVYRSKKLPAFTPVYYKVKPRESTRIYRDFFRSQKIKTAVSYIQKHRAAFDKTEKTFGVSATVIASILLIETHFGANTGSKVVVHRLSRLANIADPDNMMRNYQDLKKKNEPVTVDEVVARGKLLHQMFFPEVVAAFEIARKQNFDVFSLKGSSAGAFGYPQFLPSTYLRFAVDGDGDGTISLYDHEDAIASIASFLKGHGWKEHLSRKEREEIVWHYNHSDAYVAAVLDVAARIRSKLK